MTDYKCARGATLRVPYVITGVDLSSVSVHRAAIRRKDHGKFTGAQIITTTEQRAAQTNLAGGFDAVFSAVQTTAFQAGTYQLDMLLSINSEIEETEPLLIEFYDAASS